MTDPTDTQNDMDEHDVAPSEIDDGVSPLGKEAGSGALMGIHPLVVSASATVARREEAA